MKVGEYEVKEGYYYTKTHEWAKVEDDVVRVGITDYAQKSLKDLVYIEFIDENEATVEVGDEVKAGDQIAAIESVKATSEVLSPVSGEVQELNTELEDSPELANQDPYEKGWLMVIKPSDLDEDLSALMDEKEYAEYLKKVES